MTKSRWTSPAALKLKKLLIMTTIHVVLVSMIQAQVYVHAAPIPINIRGAVTAEALSLRSLSSITPDLVIRSPIPSPYPFPSPQPQPDTRKR
ncbi:hypothetical protein H0H93_000846, partial [Arthromyces matolae]